MLTVGKLKELLVGVPDELTVFIPLDDGSFICAVEENTGITELGDPCDKDGKPAETDALIGSAVFTVSN